MYGQDIGKAEADARTLGKQFGVKTVPKLKEFLFCVHTYFALLMKLLAAEVMTLQRGAMMQSFITPLVSANSDDFRKALKDLEDGGLFAHQGINNFLEGDFFSWYLSVWDKSLTDDLRAMLKALARFDPRTPYLAPEQSRDLLKKLYQYLVPKKLRHDLGEFYTPDWLAEHVLNQLEYNGDLQMRLLDPACGSGTFLILAIRRMKEWALQHDPPIEPETVAKKILDNLCGFDLNPIAVIAARTNFLLAMGELVRYVRPIEIPIYMCDAVLTPSEYAELFGKGYRIPTAAGEFEIPSEIVQSDQMEKLAGLLEQCAPGDYSAREFLNRAKRELVLTHQATFDGLERLYTSIHKLEKQNRNGIWARWLKNAFAPLFKGKFHFVAGNPPWINWQSLADEYRKATRRLWEKYGLFSLKGHEARLGGGKKDFAMLFVYAASDSYLQTNGRLGFVITQTVFKTKGAGDGFRRFLLPRGIHLGVLRVDDFSPIQPFEGASNRTACVVLNKGSKSASQVPYILWNASDGEPLHDDDFGAAFSKLRSTELVAYPAISTQPTSPWINLPPGASGAVAKISGQSAYKGWVGACTWYNSIYWIRVVSGRPDGLIIFENLGDTGRAKAQLFKGSIEPELVYPLLRGRDIGRWNAKASAHLILSQDPKTRSGYSEPWLRTRLPHTYQYFKHFEHLLRKRSGYKKYFSSSDPFYSIYNVGEYTLSPVKVCWAREDIALRAAVCGMGKGPTHEAKPVVPDQTVMFIPISDPGEAHYVCAVLNSTPAVFLPKAYTTDITLHVLSVIRIPKFDARIGIHKKLSELSEAAHDLASRLSSRREDERAKRELCATDDEIDRAAAKLWGLSNAELDEIRKALELLK